jgi:hypothetical protein
MQAGNHIRYLQRREIDIARWDDCIAAAPNGLIYARSFYLDAMTAGQWDALVLGDYKAVMPLPWRRKFGFYYLYQPDFIPALGIFGSPVIHTLSAGIPADTPASIPTRTLIAPPVSIPVSDFLGAVPQKFKFWEIDLNESNGIGDNPPSSIKVTNRLNSFLPLAKPYEDIHAAYKRLALRMCKKALDEGLEVIRQVPPADIIGYYQKEYGHRHHKHSGSTYERLIACAGIALRNGNAAAYLARWPDNSIGAFYLVLSDDRFVYSLLGGSTSKGKEKGAFYLLTDAVIRDHASSDRIFRFEGSDIPGIAFFNTQFGPRPVHYPSLVMNNLPFPVNLFK